MQQDIGSTFVYQGIDNNGNNLLSDGHGVLEKDGDGNIEKLTAMPHQSDWTSLPTVGETYFISGDNGRSWTMRCQSIAGINAIFA